MTKFGMAYRARNDSRSQAIHHHKTDLRSTILIIFGVSCVRYLCARPRFMTSTRLPGLVCNTKIKMSIAAADVTIKKSGSICCVRAVISENLQSIDRICVQMDVHLSKPNQIVCVLCVYVKRQMWIRARKMANEQKNVAAIVTSIIRSVCQIAVGHSFDAIFASTSIVFIQAERTTFMMARKGVTNNNEIGDREQNQRARAHAPHPSACTHIAL